MLNKTLNLLRHYTTTLNRYNTNYIEFTLKRDLKFKMMRARILFSCLIVSLAFAACNKTKPFNGDVKFTTIEVLKNGTEIDPDTTKIYEADIKYYQITEAPEYLKDSINQQTRIFLSNWFEVPLEGEYNINQLVDNDLKRFYKQVDELNDKDCYTCRIKQINMKGEDIYQNNKLLSMSYCWYIYEGGAHGNYGKICYNYEKTTGKKITYKNLVKDEAKLLAVAETKFKEQNGIPANEQIADMFQFENNKFSLNDNFRFTDSSLVFYYNPYEIAPYAAGLIELNLPYNDIKELVNYVSNQLENEEK